ncbi:hypothetical protein CROQUDRAFT_100310 [Cronartium quercuum f. sp. fusiforme G11]|uniref:Uncharacterized protein n=1 Tax=Cronartium quercuum f. sp. fusiforme G11 TaxID=708437 RepID=A0A9P6T681_9BASI|nr:hypothetical protein CROQUDRAFT_100310 [Cronartium quercuum f. sp. fusiforme G11]
MPLDEGIPFSLEGHKAPVRFVERGFPKLANQRCEGDVSSTQLNVPSWSPMETRQLLYDQNSAEAGYEPSHSLLVHQRPWAARPNNRFKRDQSRHSMRLWYADQLGFRSGLVAASSHSDSGVGLISFGWWIDKIDGQKGTEDRVVAESDFITPPFVSTSQMESKSRMLTDGSWKLEGVLVSATETCLKFPMINGQETGEMNGILNSKEALTDWEPC